MKKYISLVIIVLAGLLYSCEKDGEQVFIVENPTAPEIVSMPDLTLERNNGTDMLEFVCNPVDPGFQASVNYFLEASSAGESFATPILIKSQIDGTAFTIQESELNSLMLKYFPADETSSVDFRVRSRLVVDAGTAAPGTSDNTFEYISETVTADLMPYGLPRLDLLNSGMEQKLESTLGNGVYSGFVKLNTANPFTLLDPDNNTEYGGSAGTLSVDGAGIVVDESGWYDFTADINDLTYTADPYFIGLVGDATPNGWDAPDQKMDYNAEGGYWYITIDLVVGHIKFRLNDSWSWNMGFVEGETPGMSGNLQQGGVGNDIPINEAGNYTIIFTILSDDAGTYEIIKN
jgi:starch-binding outer membrane protein SusE/F